jgi:hypothetical protein
MKSQYFAKVTDFDYATGITFDVRVVEVDSPQQADYCFISENGVSLSVVKEYLDTGLEPFGVQVVKVYKGVTVDRWPLLHDPS